jgi:uncharacterized protein with ParB-like and HNH nuclease domain
MSYSTQSKSVSSLIDEIESNNYYLPAIQREFVWPSGKIESLFDSLLRDYPVGTLLLWDVGKEAVHEFQFYELLRNFDDRKRHNIKANLRNRERCIGILDGQQRITSLYIGLLGSYKERLFRKHATNPDAYPEKKLYINLLFVPEPDDPERKFQVRFRTEQQIKNAKQEEYWFPLGDILKYRTRDELRTLRRSKPEYRDNNAFEDNLDALWTAIHERHSVSYYLEKRQDLDDVLEIFKRLNTGGTPLSYSDLLLSLATATWQTHDAREQVYELVDYLNKHCGSEFRFSKDFVLKALLVCSDQDVRFRTENIRKKIRLEDIWDKVKESLQLTVKLVAQFGFNGHTLTASNAIIPIAYYLYRRKKDDNVFSGERFLTGESYADDRETIRGWLLKILLGKAFQRATDQLLTNIRDVIQATLKESSLAAFPADAINERLRSSRGFLFTDENIETLVGEASYGSPDAFSILALLYPHLRYEYSQFHIDHMHPKSHFTKSNLRDAGLDGDDIELALGRCNLLPNLQLLPGPVNEAKKAKPFTVWLDEQTDPKWSHSEFP